MASKYGDGFQTGYPKFDTLSKGLKAGEILTIAARTGVGKTNFIITPIRTFCESGKKVLLFSTEMSFDQIWQRYRSTLVSDVEFSRHLFYVCDEFTPDITRIEEAIRHVNPDLFVFDHISHIGTDYHIISAFMGNIKRLARLFNIPAIVTAQLNRNADWVENGERVTPRMSMIQGSGSIEQMSAQVLLLSEKRVYPDHTEIDGVIDKNRHGDKGLIKFGLFNKPYYHVREL
jgi:replicative DNA helicase